MTPGNLAICVAPKQDSRHWEQTDIDWADLVAWMEHPSNTKACGNYLLGTLQPNTTVTHLGEDGPCTNLHRRKGFVVSRSGITLDVDAPDPGFADRVELMFDHACILHTTFNSSPDEPRYRLIIPTDRPLLPDEYVVAARSIMQDLGIEQFDLGSDQPERYMFRPSAQEPGWFTYLVVEGEVIVVDDLLADFEEDLSTKPLPKPGKNKRDPYEIDGVIGAFNKAYEDDWDLLIATYDLPYEKIDDDRYHLIGARSQAGMGPIPDTSGFVYSHHANDPAYGRACSAFDLVRLHMFGDLDVGLPAQTPVNKLNSNAAMMDVASGDFRVTAQIVGADFDDPIADDWRLGIRLAPRSGKFLDDIRNWDLVTTNDPVFGLLYYNMMSLAVEFKSDPPWRSIEQEPTVYGTDRGEIGFYVERTYGIRPTRDFMDRLIDVTAVKTQVHPIRDYLDTLQWDGTPRVETCLPGVRSTDFTRLVARKSMVAAVGRIYDPGCKWDHTLVLYGSEGLGKSWWIDKMARGYSSSLGRVDNKDTLLTMQRSWIMVSDEGYSLRKGDSDQLKEFLTRTSDVFRLPYERDTLLHKRHCVIWSTTNDETFLRRQEGNRRFLIVHCEDKVDFNLISDAYVDQVWAEAVHLYRAGEVLFLDEPEAEIAEVERERFVEEDALAGIIAGYLGTLVPPDWWERSKESRRQWFLDREDAFEKEGTMQVDRVCTTQIWVEVLGRRLGDHRRADLLDISNALKRLGWATSNSAARLPGYGPQKVFIREDLL